MRRDRRGKGGVVEDTTSFFFSSRRRHTRYWRDWSSDVCSSDLALTVQGRNEVRSCISAIRGWLAWLTVVQEAMTGPLPAAKRKSPHLSSKHNPGDRKSVV